MADWKAGLVAPLFHQVRGIAALVGLPRLQLGAVSTAPVQECA